MSRIKHWPKDRAGAARHIYDLRPGQERTAILDWIDSLDASFGFKITEHDGNTYLKAHDITVQVDESPAVIELLRRWAENEVSPTPRKSLIRIDPDADQIAIKKIQGLSIQNPTPMLSSWENDTSQLLAVNMPGDPDSQPGPIGPIRSEAASPTADEHLTDNDRRILLYMLEHGHDIDNPIKKLAVAKRLNIGDDKNMMNHLKQLGLVKGKRGTGNGFYLTEKGWQRAERITRGRSKTD